MERSELPEGWRWGVLGDSRIIIDIQPGFACGKKDVSDGIPHLRMNNVSKNGFLDMTLVRRIPKEKANSAGKWLEPGDIIFNNTNSTELVGKSCIFTGWSEPCTFSNHLTRIRANPRVLSRKWLYTCLRELWLSGYFATNCIEFIGQSAFNKNKLKEVEIPIPPLAEQNRIVTRIEELTRRVEEARGLRREAVGNISDFFIANISQIFRGNGGWRETVLGEVLNLVQYGLSSKMSIEPRGYPVIRMGNIQGGRVITEDLKYLDMKASEASKYLLKKGDILINRTNSAELVGKAGLFQEGGGYLFASYLIRLRVNSKVADPAFINYFINSPDGQAF